MCGVVRACARWSGGIAAAVRWGRPVRGRRYSFSYGKGCKTGLDILYDQIKISGPITVAEYMKQCLLHPVFGYYMQGDVFGARGDFITSPEISQVFGELLAVWVLADWRAHGETTPLQLVELGPGRGTLLKDILRVFQHKQLQAITKGLSLHLIEASPALSSIQQLTLQTTPTSDADDSSYKTGSVGDIPVCWHHQLKDVPQGYNYIIAHEFFDALPVHQFKMTSLGWREVLVDIDPAPETKALCFVLSPSVTPASAVFTTGQTGTEGAWLEVCPQGLVLAQEIAERVVRGGGAALIADYGGKGSENSLRGFSEHRQCDVLESPGVADMTADVDFQALRDAAQPLGAGVFGPITQNEFLHKLGIRQRIEVLMKGASPSAAKDLVSSYEMLTSPEHMGERFKFLTISSSPTHTPVPFVDGVRIAE